MTLTVQSSAEKTAQVILKHAARISREKDVSALAQLNADLALDLVGAERCSLWLLDEGRGELWTRVAHGVSDLRIPQGVGVVGACVLEGRAIVINDVASDSRFFSGVDGSSGYLTRSMICVPLRIDQQVIGALQVLNKPGGFSREDVDLLSLVAFYSASAIQSERLRQEAESAMLLRHELGLAAEVQKRLLPEETRVKGIELATLCRPATSMGGDFYDLLPLPDCGLAITLGDVSGKGLPAAVMMASIYPLLRRLMLDDSADLARVVVDLNDSICRSSSPERYSTLFCGVLSPDRTLLRYVNAGHVPPFVLRRSSTEIEHPREGDMPVGLLPSATFTEQRVILHPGDLFVCISDGILEARGPDGELWDEAFIPEILGRTCALPVEKILTALVGAVDEYANGADQGDDMTAVILKIDTAQQK